MRKARGVFAVLLVLSVAAVGAAYYLQSQALPTQRDQAQAHAKAVASEVDGSLGTKDLREPLPPNEVRQLTDRVQHAIGDQDFSAVRVWTPDGTLAFSTVPNDKTKVNDAALQRATKGGGKASTGILVTSVDPATDQMTTYFPMRAGAGGESFGAVEVVQAYAPIVEAAKEPWLSIRQVAELVAAVFAILFLLSFVGGKRSKADAASSTEKDAAGSKRSAKTKETKPAAAATVAATAPKGPQRAPVGPSDPKVLERLASAEEGRKAVEAEVAQLRGQLKMDAERSAKESGQIREQLRKSQARVQELQVASAAAAAKPQAGPGTGTDPAAIKELQLALEAERTKAGAAETRAKGLEAQLQRDASKPSEASSADADAMKAKLAEAEKRAQESKELVTELRAHATALESKVMEAETRVADHGARAAELDAEVKRLSSQPSSPPAVAADEGFNPEYTQQLEQELEQTQTRLRRAYAEAENARAELSYARGSGDAVGVDPALARARSDTDRLKRELESALERAREAEDRAAGLQDTVLQDREASEDDGAQGSEVPEEGLAPVLTRNDVWSSVAPTPKPAPAAGDDVGDAEATNGDVSSSSLRSRLAKTAARKKPRPGSDPGDDVSDWS